SSSVKPTARSIALLGIRSTPPVMIRLRAFSAFCTSTEVFIVFPLCAEIVHVGYPRGCRPDGFLLRKENGRRVPFSGEEAPAIGVRHGEREAPTGNGDRGRGEGDGNRGARVRFHD